MSMFTRMLKAVAIIVVAAAIVIATKTPEPPAIERNPAAPHIRDINKEMVRDFGAEVVSYVFVFIDGLMTRIESRVSAENGKVCLRIGS